MSKILFFDFNLPYLLEDRDYPVGGATVQAQKWIAGLSALGKEVGVLIDGFCGDALESDIEFVKSFDLNKGIPFLNWIYYRYPKLNRAVKTYRPDYIYHAGAGFTSWVLATIARKNQIKFIYRVANDADTDERLKRRLTPLTRFLYQRSLKITDIILCQNRYQFQNLKKKVPEKSIAIFHNPYDFSGALPVIKPLTERKYIAWLGIFQYQKNLAALLNTVKRLSSIEFRIAGKPQKRLDLQTKRALSELDKCPNVRFVGFLRRAEISNFLNKAYALLNTSYYEGFSNTFLEALAAGTPIVCTTNVDPDAMIANHGLGKTCYTHDQLARTLETLMGLKDYFEMCKKCQQYALQSHDCRVLAKRLLEILNSAPSSQ